MAVMDACDSTWTIFRTPRRPRDMFSLYDAPLLKAHPGQFDRDLEPTKNWVVLIVLQNGLLSAWLDDPRVEDARRPASRSP